MQNNEACNVQHIVNRFSSPERSHSGNHSHGDSPRWGRNHSVGARSRHAQRALGVFPSRSFSAGASGGSLSSKIRGSAVAQASSSGCSITQSEAIGKDECMHRTLSRRLSMGDPRTSRLRPLRTSTVVRSAPLNAHRMGRRNFGAISMHVQEVQQDETSTGSGEAKRQAVGHLPLFLHRNAVESIDVKPW